jgi:ABC-type branched-subunit amino acid transport system permease subunit
VVTAAVLGGGGWAVQESLTGAQGNPAGGQQLWIALGAMAAVGLVVGLVVAGRVSPIATFIPSMVLLAWTVVYALDMNRALSLVPDQPSMHEIVRQAATGSRTLLTSGVYALLGVALFIPVLMPSRWSRGHDDEDDEYEQTSDEGGYY